MDFWKRPRRKSQKGKVRNDTVRTTVDVGKKEKYLEKRVTTVWTCKEISWKYITT
jgi:hypothetical protein